MFKLQSQNFKILGQTIGCVNYYRKGNQQKRKLPVFGLFFHGYGQKTTN